MIGSQFSFAYPFVLLLLLLLVPLVWRYLKGLGRGAIRFSALGHLKVLRRGPMVRSRHILIILQVLTLACLIFAGARPRFGKSISERKSEGLDIVLAIDTSGSMRAVDLTLSGTRYDRLTVVKNVVKDFIEKRRDDRIGMVVFGTEAYTQSPLTLDHDVVQKFLGQLEIEMAGPNTAIGNAVATASRRLEKIKSKSKIIILLTDGENTAGNVDPLEAAKAAATLGIKIYTIGVGSNGRAPYPVSGFFGTTTRMMEVRIDEKLLKEMAQLTGGQSFLATNTEALVKIYETIDKLEKTEIEVNEYVDYKEAAHLFLWPAMIFLILESLLSLTRLRSIP